jgi:hypothetical protein
MLEINKIFKAFFMQKSILAYEYLLGVPGGVIHRPCQLSLVVAGEDCDVSQRQASSEQTELNYGQNIFRCQCLLQSLVCRVIYIPAWSRGGVSGAGEMFTVISVKRSPIASAITVKANYAR